MAVNSPKPKFKPFETWGACSRCGARVRYSSLRRERLTGMLMCSSASGRKVRPCWDPWPQVYDFQVYPDKSIEPPPEPLPARWNLDNIWGNGPATGTTADFANAPKAAPDDATRLANLLTTVPYYAQLGKSAAFTAPPALLPTVVQNLTTIVPANYDGTFLPSQSVRTVTPPDEATELANVGSVSGPAQDPLWGDVNWGAFDWGTPASNPVPIASPPWSAIKKV